MSQIQRDSQPSEGLSGIRQALRYQPLGIRSTRALLLLASMFFLADNTLWTHRAAGAGVSILYFGNSFTLGLGSTRSVPDLVSDIALAAGYDAPYFVDASTDGADFVYHSVVASAWANAYMPPSNHWDYVVLQDYSTEPTHIGSLANHLTYGQYIYQQIDALSPGVVPVLFETWARGPGSVEYTGPSPDFPGGPTQMQAEVRDGYQQLAALLGPQSRVAAVGDAFEAAGFLNSLYDPDMVHAQNLGTLIASLVIFESIYGSPRVNDIDLSGILMNLNLLPSDGDLASSLIAVPEPSTFALCGIAAVALMAHGRRRRRV